MIKEMQDVSSRIRPNWEGLIHSPVFEVMRHIQEITRALQDLISSPTVRVAKDSQRQNELWHKLVDLPAHKLISKTEKHFQQLINSVTLPALQAISNEALRYFQSASAVSRFPESFVAQVLDQLKNIQDVEEKEEVEKEARIIEKLFAEQIGKLRPEFISREGMIQILLAIIFLWYQMYQSMKMEQHIVDTIQATETRILEKIEKLKSTESKEVFYIVLHRSALLRSHPASKKPALGIIDPYRRVSLIAAKGKWLHIRYFDYIDGSPKSGWVLKKYLKRIGVSKDVERLIASDISATNSFDEILAPVRKTFQESDMSESDLETLFKEAREEVYQGRKAKRP
jgi:hypothetical protein